MLKSPPRPPATSRYDVQLPSGSWLLLFSGASLFLKTISSQQKARADVTSFFFLQMSSMLAFQLTLSKSTFSVTLAQWGFNRCWSRRGFPGAVSLENSGLKRCRDCFHVRNSQILYCWCEMWIFKRGTELIFSKFRPFWQGYFFSEDISGNALYGCGTLHASLCWMVLRECEVPLTTDGNGAQDGLTSQIHKVNRGGDQTQGFLTSCPACAPSNTLLSRFWTLGLPWWLSGKEPACRAGGAGEAGLAPGRRQGNLLQYSCLENPMTEVSSGLQRGSQRDTTNVT